MALKVKRENLEIFSLSFLDIISCAFAAVVILVLLSKSGVDDQGGDGIVDIARIQSLLSQLYQLSDEQEATRLSQQKADATLAQLITQEQGAKDNLAELKKQLLAQQQSLSQLEVDASALSLIVDSQKKVASIQGSQLEKDDEVGGIPVDSEYVIFILDTSGSMQSIWGRVLKEMENILDNHPQVKGFQVMNDMGNYLLSAYRGRWIKDSPRVRNSVLAGLRKWGSYSNSSPVEGLEVALKTYARKGSNYQDKYQKNGLAIYIFGDDYSGGSYDEVIETLNRLNTNRTTGERIARVHAIGFVSNANTNRFSTLMREVTKQNKGTFLALPY